MVVQTILHFERTLLLETVIIFIFFFQYSSSLWPVFVESSLCDSSRSFNFINPGYRSFRSAFDEDIPGLPIPSMVGAAGSDIEHKMGIMPPFIPNAIHASMNRINWTNTKQSGDQQVPGPYQYSPEVQKAIESILFIAEHIRKEDKDNNVRRISYPFSIVFCFLISSFLKVIEDWKYVAMVLDRLFLWIFTIACVVGTCGILLQAPSLYDQRVPIDSQLSQIGR